MTPQEAQIKQLQDEVASLKETLVKYGDLYNADGSIDSAEQKVLDEKQAIIKIIEDRLALLAKKYSSSPPPPNKAPLGGGDKFTKPFYDGKVGQKYELHVMVDQPGTGGDRDPYEIGWSDGSVDVGHTFVKLIKTNVDGTKVEAVFGFYPATAVDPLSGLIEVAGKLVDDKGHGSEVQADKVLKHKQFFAALKYIEENRTNKYNLDKFNCTDFAIEVAGAAGWNISSKRGSWPGGSGRNPGDLGEDLKEASAKAKKETGTVKPSNKKIK